MRPHNNADSGRGKSKGLNSPHGRRGAICAHFGWTYDYLLNGISWALVEKMMMDAPSYDSGDGDTERYMDATDGDAENIMNYINSLM